MAEISMNDFVRLLSEEEDVAERRMLQLAYEIAEEVRLRAIRNVDEKLGNGRFSGAGADVAAYKKGRSGGLRNSIQLELVGRWPVVTAGGPGVPYAAVHEYGTVGKGGELPDIVPRRAKALTIPASPDFVPLRARESNLKLAVFGKTGKAALVTPEGEIAYWLVKRVAIEPRPYLAPAAEQVLTDPVVAAKIQKIFGQSELPYEVTKL